jgi:hypothetical protein
VVSRNDVRLPQNLPEMSFCWELFPKAELTISNQVWLY